MSNKIKKTILIDGDYRLHKIFRELNKSEEYDVILIDILKDPKIPYQEYNNFSFFSSWVHKTDQSSNYGEMINNLITSLDQINYEQKQELILFLNAFYPRTEIYSKIINGILGILSEKEIFGYVTIDDCSPYYGFIARCMNTLGKLVLCYLHGSLYDVDACYREHVADFYCCHGWEAQQELLRIRPEKNIFITGNIEFENNFDLIKVELNKKDKIIGIALSHYDDADENVAEINLVIWIISILTKNKGIKKILIKPHPYNKTDLQILKPFIERGNIEIVFDKDKFFMKISVLCTISPSSIAGEASLYRIPVILIYEQDKFRISSYKRCKTVLKIKTTEFASFVDFYGGVNGKSLFSNFSDMDYLNSFSDICGPTDNNVKKLTNTIDYIFGKSL